MKLLFYRVNGKGKRKSLDANVERILFVSCITAFFLLVIIQTAMISPTVQTFLEARNSLEGEPLGVEEYLFEEGQISLQLIDTQCNYDLKVLVNGDEVAAFSDMNITVTVRDGDVIELDTGNVGEMVQIQVTSKSDNVMTQCVGKRYKAKPGITKLLKVELDDGKA